MKVFLSLPFLFFISCHTPCDTVKEQRVFDIQGVVIQKYSHPIDESERSIIFSNDASSLRELIMTDDHSDMWSKLSVGDSIVKMGGSDLIYRYSGAEVDTLKLDFRYCK
jgi:hypothetical protein